MKIVLHSVCSVIEGELHTADIQTKAIMLLSLQLSLQLSSVTRATTPLMNKPASAQHRVSPASAAY